MIGRVVYRLYCTASGFVPSIVGVKQHLRDRTDGCDRIHDLVRHHSYQRDPRVGLTLIQLTIYIVERDDMHRARSQLYGGTLQGELLDLLSRLDDDTSAVAVLHLTERGEKLRIQLAYPMQMAQHGQREISESSMIDEANRAVGRGDDDPRG